MANERTTNLYTRTEEVVVWLRKNLFSTWYNAVLSIVSVYVIWVVASGFVNWAFINAVGFDGDRDTCVMYAKGACWPFIEAKWSQIIYGRYPEMERWRVDVTFLIGALAVVPMLMPSMPFKRANAVFLLVPYPILGFFLLNGGAFGLEPVETPLWGGLLVTLVVAIVGIVASLPIGILLALGRRSEMPVIRILCVGFIEFWRGVPLITVLFMASVMLPLFLPQGVTFDKLLRCLIGIALFSSAYMAEVVRGGLQSIPRGQYEAAQALGLGYWKMMGLIVLPQALKLVIPGIVNTFIGLFKDTTLVLIIGLFDLLGIVQLSFSDPSWSTPQTAATGYAVVGIIFWIFCYGMSRYSQFMERYLHTGHKR
ncbi:MAG: amino acid ABC transporter permease [Parvularculales bacterium]